MAARKPIPLPRRSPVPIDSLLLEGVRDTGKVVGKGATATIQELDYRGLICVGKILHRSLIDFARPEEKAALLERFKDECLLLSRLHHPRVVQFMGIFYEPKSDLPVLVMEYLHMNLTTCLDTYKVLPKEISYGILRDVATGLRYLHEHSPPIIHRDLTANNVLLTPGMDAKISDLGVAKILNLTPAQMTQITQAPGTPCYMPPEALMAKPKYTNKIDSYSYGVLLLHTLCGEWPFPSPSFKDDPKKPGTPVPVSEVDRRGEHLAKIADKHPEVVNLIHQCLSNTPDCRPNASVLLDRISSLHSKLSSSFLNKVEMMKSLEGKCELLANENRMLAAKNQALETTIQSKDVEMDALHKKLALKTLGEKKRLSGQSSSLGSVQPQPHLFHPQAKLTWSTHNNIPFGLTGAQAVVLQQQVYIGGSVAGQTSDLHLVFQYDPKQDTWTLLPSCPVRFFGMSHFRGHLVTVGGKNQDGTITGKVYCFALQGRWEEFLQPMQVPRAAPSVVSTLNVLVACGGAQDIKHCEPVVCRSVEIFSDRTLKWQLADPLPMPCHFMSVAVISNTCYLLGGRGGTENDDITSVFYASIPSLIQNAAQQVSPQSSTTTTWGILPNTPLKRSTAASLSGCLLAVGGYDDRQKSQAIHVYLPSSNSWIRLLNSDLPAPRWGCTVAQLDYNKLLVTSGRDDSDHRTNTVFQGSINLQSRT